MNRSPYNEPYAQNAPPVNGTYDENFIEELSKRLAKRTVEELIARQRSTPSSGMRLALAIVSLIILIPILVTTFTVASQGNQIWSAVIIAFITCVAVCIINIVFNISHR